MTQIRMGIFLIVFWFFIKIQKLKYFKNFQIFESNLKNTLKNTHLPIVCNFAS